MVSLRTQSVCQVKKSISTESDLDRPSPAVRPGSFGRMLEGDSPYPFLRFATSGLGLIAPARCQHAFAAVLQCRVRDTARTC
jgi:hypothetical protein